MKLLLWTALTLAALRALLVSRFATVTELGSSASRYFEEEKRRHSYLSEKGQASSFWLGSGLHHIGVSKGEPVTLEQFEALSSNVNPLTGESLVQRQAGKNIKPGHDVTLGAPKSVAVVGLLGPLGARVAVHDSVRASIESTLKKADALCPRNRGKGGARKELPPENERVWMVYPHLTNRDGVVHAHWHCITHHIAWSKDGSTGRTERRGLLDYQKELGAHFLRRLDSELMARGFETEKTVSRSGRLESFRIKGFPKQLEDALSGRTRVIEETIEREGWTSPRAKDVVSQRTRSKKRHQTREQLIDATWAACKAHGLDERALEKLCEGVTREKQVTRERSANVIPFPLERVRPRPVALNHEVQPTRRPANLVEPREPRHELPTHGQYVSCLLHPTLERDGSARVLVGESEGHARALNVGAQSAARTLGRLGLRSTPVFDGKVFEGDRVRLRWRWREGRQRADVPLVSFIKEKLLGREPRRAGRFEHGTVERIVNRRLFWLFTRRVLIVRLDESARTWAGFKRRRVIALKASSAARALELGYAASEARSREMHIEPVRLTPKAPVQHVAKRVRKSLQHINTNERGGQLR